MHGLILFALTASAAPTLPAAWSALQPLIAESARIEHVTDSCLVVKQGQGAPDYEPTLKAFADLGCVVVDNEGQTMSSYGTYRYVARLDAACLGKKGQMKMDFEDAKHFMTVWLTLDGADCPKPFTP